MRTVVCHDARQHPAHEWTVDSTPVTCPGVSRRPIHRVLAPLPSPLPGSLLVHQDRAYRVVSMESPGMALAQRLLTLQCGSDEVHTAHIWTSYIGLDGEDAYCAGAERQLDRAKLLEFLDNASSDPYCTPATIAMALREGQFDVTPGP